MWQRLYYAIIATSLFLTAPAFAASGQFQSMHLAGSHNGWNVSSVPMRLVDNNLWFVAIELEADDRFKFVPQNWSLSFGDNNQDGVADSFGGGDIDVPSASGWYHINFNDQNYTYQIVAADFNSNHPAMHIVGTFNDWALNDAAMKLIDDNVWHINIDIPVETLVKFVPSSWALSYGDINADGIADAQGDGDIYVPLNGNIDIYFNDATLAYSFEKQVSNEPPIANAGEDIVVMKGEQVTLDGAGSSDPEGQPLSYMWSNGETQAVTSFVVNDVGEFEFTLTVTDDQGVSASDVVTVFVEPNEISGNYPAMHLAGSHNSWNVSANPMQLVSQNTWQIELMLAATDQFKFVPESWALSFGDNDQNGIADSDGDGNIPANLGAGKYTITFNDESLAYTLSIETIEPVDSIIEIEQHRSFVQEGDSLQLSVIDKETGNAIESNDIVWRSLNPDWVSISGGGQLTVNSAKWGYAFLEATVGENVATAKVFTGVNADAVCNAQSRDVTLHYYRPDGDYSNWGLHLWGEGWNTDLLTTWQSPKMFDNRDDFGVSVTLNVANTSLAANFIVHRGDVKDPTADLVVPCTASDVYLVAGDANVYLARPDTGGPADRAARWVSESRIEWPSGGSNPTLYYSRSGLLYEQGGQVQGGDSVQLSGSGGVYSLPNADRRNILRSQIWLRNSSGLVTGIQIQGVLDALFANDEPLGVVKVGADPKLAVWAPTAQQVNLRLFDNEDTTSTTLVPLRFDSQTGIWSVQGDATWWGKYYLYDVTVYHPLSDRIEIAQVTDPYSIALSLNSQRSQIADLSSAKTKPAGWDAIAKSPLSAPEDAAIYELHVRDFSAIAEPSELLPEFRGKYLAFTQENYSGTQHLQSLADAGMTHIHLMPVFDIATINEDAVTRDDRELEGLGAFGPTSETQQATVGEYRSNDAFNWGYDPFHYGVPEGSYAVNADGEARIYEFRQMVAALYDMGYRVVTDVVYNHTAASGLWFTSVLDRVVPGYYHRLNKNGSIQRSTCCEDTASEYRMMEKLMSDTLVHWARTFKIDAFRFDLMGHHLKSNIAGTVRSKLNELTMQQDGVDGSGIYLYGEGWDFGGISGRENMDQINSAGTGVGTYNDRIRDALTGGPFEDTLQSGGVLHGNYGGYGISNIDRVRIGLAGNLREYWSNDGGDYPVGYTLDPQENIPYVSKHDNYTLWDMTVTKSPRLSLQDRVKVQGLGMAYVVLAQGVPFIHAGVDLLRSKSGDRDSYDSGDWFNALDFNGNQNKWGSGLPPTWTNNATVRQELWRPLLGDSRYKAGSSEIALAKQMLRNYLAVRSDVKLLRLETGQQIRQHLSFENNDRANRPGVIVVKVNDDGLNIDPKYRDVITIFNAEASEYSASFGFLNDRSAQLHPELTHLQGSATVSGNRLTVPARSAAVFVVTD